MKRLRRLALMCGCISMLACTTMEPLPVNSVQLQKEVRPGDHVSVTRSKGSPLQFDVVRVDKQGLHGSGIHVPYNDIQGVSREETSWWRTGLIALGVVAAGVLIISASKGGGGGGGGGGW